MFRIANAPCSWGVLEFDLEGQTIGYAQVLDEMQATGYQGTELGDWGFMPSEPHQLKQELAARQLQLLGAFVPIALANGADHESGTATAVRTARLLAAVAGESPFIVLADDSGKVPQRTQYAGRIEPEHSLDEAGWRTFAAGAERVARAVRETTGLRTVFHHHCASYVETAAELDQLLNLTDADLLGLCFDTGHYRFAGGDPVSAVARYGGRIWHMHLKDCQPAVAARSRSEGWDYFNAVRQGVFCELGQGDVDFPAVLDQLRRQDYGGWLVVEQDVLPNMGSPRESARRNRDYLSRIEV